MPLRAATASATARVPASKRGSSNAPIGPFQNTVRASAITSPNSAAVPGPMSTPFHPSGRSVPAWRTCAALVGLEQHAVGRQRGHVGREVDAVAVLGEQPPARVDLVGLDQRVADAVALGDEEREAHAAADHEGVDDTEQRLDDGELVGHLRPAEHGDEGPQRLLPHAEQHLDLALEQPAGGRRQRRRRTDDRRVGAVRRAEGVVDVGVEARRSASATKAGSLPSSPGSNRRFSSSSTPGASSASRARTGVDGVLRVRLPLGPAEVRAGDDRRALLLQPPQRRHRGADAEVVGDAAVLERHVEVAADEDAPAVDRRQVLQGGDPELRHGDRLLGGGQLGAGDLDEVDQPVRVAPLVVVPAHDLHEVAHRHRERASNVHDAGEPTMSELTIGASL